MVSRFLDFSGRAYLLASRFKRGMTLGVRAALFDEEARVFLVRHTYVRGWYLPGGGVEAGETAEDAVHRELNEEGGFRLDGRPELFGFYFNSRHSRRDHVALYICRDWIRAETVRVPNLEIAECGFFARDSLPEDTTEATVRRLAEIDGRIPRAAEW